jgi:hypothetical protein
VAAVEGLNHLLKCAAKFPDTITAAELKAADQVAYEVKRAWLGIMSGHGHSPAAKIKRRPWTVRDRSWANQRGTVKASVYFRGAVHLLFSPTKPHIIAAVHLGTRTSTRAKGRRLGASAAFGVRDSRGGIVGNRGVFGTLKNTTTRAGVTKARMGARALHIAGTNWRPYAFHPGTSGERAIWEESKQAARIIAPRGFGPARQQALVAAGFGQAAGLGKALAK